MAAVDSAPTPTSMRGTATGAFKDGGLIAFGVLSVGFGIKGFLYSNHFIDGGITGISMLLAGALDWPLAVALLLMNLPFVILGYRLLGAAFAIKSALAVVGLAACVAFVPYPHVTSDNVLTAVFGGIFIGAGIGFTMRGGAAVDGTDIAAIVISNRTPLLKVSDVILLLNVLIFLAAATLLGIDRALYSVLTYVSAAKSLDFVVYGIEEYTGITIVSEHSEQITRALTQNLRRGVTLYRGTGGFGRHGERTDMDIVFTVATRLELPSVLREVSRLDPRAFITQHRIDDAAGGMLKRRRLH